MFSTDITHANANVHALPIRKVCFSTFTHTRTYIYIYHFCIVINTYAHADIYLVFGIYYSVHVFAMIHTKMVIDLADDGNEEG